MIVWFWTILLLLFTLLCVYEWQKHTYWSRRGVKTGKFVPFVGHMFGSLFKKNKLKYGLEHYLKVKEEKYRGVYIFTSPLLIIYDLDLIKAIMVKEADSFSGKRQFANDADDSYASELLFSIEGQNGKALRSILSPVFTSGKIKLTFPLVSEKADLFIIECEKMMKEKSFVQVKDLIKYYALDVIGSCAFGVDTMCLQKKKDSPLAIEMHFNPFVNPLRILLTIALPKLAGLLGILTFNYPFTKKVVNKVISERLSTGKRRGDFLDFFLEALNEHENGKSGKYNMTMDTVKAQVIQFLLAGFDTVGSTLTLILYNAAKYTVEQEKLRTELTKLREKSGEFTYQNIMEAPYLDAFVSESMRIYPAAPSTERKCSATYRIPDTDVVIEKSIMVNIPIYNFHHDPDYWPEPFKFDPERFMPEKKRNIVPFSYMPFGMGPRNCIAMRFALLEIKVLIAKIVVDYDLSLNPGFQLKMLDNGMNCRADDNGVEIVMNKIK